MKKFTTVAVIAALALATQAFAIGGSTKGGQTMSSTMTKTTINTGSKMSTGAPAMESAAQMNGSKMTTGAHAMDSTAAMNGTGTMNTTKFSTGTTKTKMTPASPIQPATTK
jgi:hypothetical protein